MDNEVLEQPGVGTATTEPPSLRETLERVVESNPIEAPAPDRETPEQTAYNPAQRDAQGRFTPRQREQAAKARDGAAVPTQEEVREASQPLPEEEHHEESETAASPSIDNAPKSWKAGPREKWAGLDPEVRAEVHRRERESSRAINDAAPVRQFAKTFQEVIAPHSSRYASSGLSPLHVVKNLMEADQVLSQAPAAQRAQFMAKLINDYGIDVRMLDAALSGGDPREEPMAVVEQLLDRRLAPLQEFVQTAQQRRQQAEQHEYSQQAQHIERMSRDPNFPHFDLVQLDMADLMEVQSRRGIYLTPEEAYKRAVAMNPEAQAAEQGRAGQQRARVAHDAATRSLGASLSVSGSPAGLKQQVAPDDLRGTIEAAWNAAQGR
jgi:hypothetical protein